LYFVNSAVHCDPHDDNDLAQKLGLARVPQGMGPFDNRMAGPEFVQHCVAPGTMSNAALSVVPDATHGCHCYCCCSISKPCRGDTQHFGVRNPTVGDGVYTAANKLLLVAAAATTLNAVAVMDPSPLTDPAAAATTLNAVAAMDPSPLTDPVLVRYKTSLVNVVVVSVVVPV
jgi:hypothetical protein